MNEPYESGIGPTRPPTRPPTSDPAPTPGPDAPPMVDAPRDLPSDLPGHLPDLLQRAVALLRCPVCAADHLTGTPRRGRVGGLTCPAGHHWDAARQGYVNLLTGAGSPYTPDTADMVAARDRFLSAGHYGPILDAVARAVTVPVTGSASAPAGPCETARRTPAVLDAGAGTGHYLAAALRALTPGGTPAGNPVGARTGTPTGSPTALATDLSPAALRVLARAVPTALPLVWDTWRRLPVRDGAVDVVLTVFAPRNLAEFGRVLAPGGRLVLVTPRPGHLAGLRELTGMLALEPEKEERLERSFAGLFIEEDRRDVDAPLTLTPAEAVDAAAMGPAGHHAGAAELTARLISRSPARSTAGLPADSADVTDIADRPLLQTEARVTVRVLTPVRADVRADDRADDRS